MLFRSAYNASFSDAAADDETPDKQVILKAAVERHQARHQGSVFREEPQAGIAQLVERNLAKVEVASSSLVSRSRCPKGKPRLPFFIQGEPPVHIPSGSRRRDSKAVMQRIANPSSPVRLWIAPPVSRGHAGIAQLVERNLAKVEVASSSLVSRSKSPSGGPIGRPRGRQR